MIFFSFSLIKESRRTLFTLKISKARWSARVKMSALRRLIPAIKKEAAIFSRRYFRSQPQIQTSVYPACSFQWKPALEEVPPRVVIDSCSHPNYTLVEIEAPDRQGLFYDLVQIFSHEKISVDLARIATEMKAAFDTFYILNAEGKKIENADQRALLEQQLSAAVK